MTRGLTAADGVVTEASRQRLRTVGLRDDGSTYATLSDAVLASRARALPTVSARKVRDP